MNQHINIEDYLEPTDPPLPLPAIETFKGTNTLDSTIEVGETMITQGYRIPLQIKQGATTKTADIYIGSSPLTQGQTITKSQSNVDLELFSGDNIIDTTLVNKPQVDLTYRSSVLGVGEAVWIHGLSAPLVAIGDVKDTLDLSTGTLTRRIKKLVLTGEESLVVLNVSLRVPIGVYAPVIGSSVLSVVNSHFQTKYSSEDTQTDENIYTTRLGASGNVFWLFVPRAFFSGDINVDNCKTEFKEWLRQQYASGTPVTVWYVLAEPETSTIPVPTGLTGTIDGYLIQDGTPTPKAPIYPAANGKEDTGGTYKVFYSYQIPISVTSGQQSTPHTIYIGSAPLTEGQSISKTSTGTEIALYQGENTISTSLDNKPEMRIDYLSTVVGVGERTGNLIEGKIANTNIDANGQIISNPDFNTWVAPIEQGVTYTFTSDTAVYAEYTEYPVLGSVAYNNTRVIVTTTFTATIDGYIAFRTSTNYATAMCIIGSTPPSAYIPHGYQIPIDIKQGDEIVDHKDIYIGNSPLLEGQSVTKELLLEDIPTYNGETIIDTTLYNKPYSIIIPTNKAANIIKEIQKLWDAVKSINPSSKSNSIDIVKKRIKLSNNVDSPVIIENISDVEVYEEEDTQNSTNQESGDLI